MHLQKIRITHTPSVPTWLAHAVDGFRFFAIRVGESGSVRLMRRFGTVCRQLQLLLQFPGRISEYRLRDAICSLDEERRNTRLAEVKLPVALWIILRATKQETALDAAIVLEPAVRDILRVRIRGQA